MAEFDRDQMLRHVARQDRGYAENDRHAIRNSTLLLKSRIHKEAFLIAMIAENLGGAATARLLEVGCGIGTMTGALRTLADSVVSIDLSAAGIEEARRRLADWPGIVLEVADGTDPCACPGIRDGAFDMILFREFHPFTRDLYHDTADAARVHQQIVTEYAPLLAPGGLIIICHADRHPQAIRIERLSLPPRLDRVVTRVDPRFVSAFLFLTRNRLSWAIRLAKLVQPLAWQFTTRNVLYVLRRGEAPSQPAANT